MVGDQDGSPAGGDVLSFARIGFVTDAQDVECCGAKALPGIFESRLPAGSFVGSAVTAVARVSESLYNRLMP